MITQPTVFILGAGASKPYGYPTGAELREQIIQNFVSDTRQYFRDRSSRDPTIETQIGHAQEFVEKFNKSSIRSIDLFLARNPGYAKMGKRAIALRILKAEKTSKFREDIENRSHDWYSYLLERLTDEITTSDDYIRFSENKVSIITFNYDRSLEYFLYESLINSFSQISKEQIKEQLCSLQFIHIFGQVAGLDWEDRPDKTEYRRDVNLVSISAVAERLHTIYEEKDNPELVQAHRLIEQAKRIFFLGFGYGQENLEILNFPAILNGDHRICGTGYRLSPKEIADIKTKISTTAVNTTKVPPSHFHIEDIDCLALLKKYL